jgi:hypothetical protein
MKGYIIFNLKKRFQTEHIRTELISMLSELSESTLMDQAKLELLLIQGKMHKTEWGE